MFVKNRFCLVKSLDGPTFCSIFYSSKYVIQTFTFLKYNWSRLDIIDIEKETSEGGGRERKRQAEQELL